MSAVLWNASIVDAATIGYFARVFHSGYSVHRTSACQSYRWLAVFIILDCVFVWCWHLLWKRRFVNKEFCTTLAQLSLLCLMCCDIRNNYYSPATKRAAERSTIYQSRDGVPRCSWHSQTLVWRIPSMLRSSLEVALHAVFCRLRQGPGVAMVCSARRVNVWLLWEHCIDGSLFRSDSRVKWSVGECIWRYT